VAKPYRKAGSKYWWIAPFIDGLQVHQSSGETDYDAADQKIKILEGKIASGIAIHPKTDRGSFQQLLELVRSDYELKKRRSLYDLAKRIDVVIGPALGHLPAAKAHLELERYMLNRQKAGVANGTINNELRHIRRAYRLGKRKGLVSEIPVIEMLPNGEARDGYYTPREFNRLLTACPNPLVRNILIVGFITGWRMRSIFRLQWSWVDMDNGFVWQTERKNQKDTRWPLDFKLEQLGNISLRDVFEEQRRTTDALKDAIVPWVFHRDGREVKSVRGAFQRALAEAGIDHVFHDLRGTAIVNLLEAGLDAPTIMNMVGLKTEHMVTHYAKRRGMRDDRLREAGKLLEMRLKNPVRRSK
jgi:integrase